MAMIPMLAETRHMVRKALQERVPSAYALMKSQGELESFMDLQATAIQERIDEANDPGPALRSDAPLLERARHIAEIRTRAVESVLAAMLSTSALRAAAGLHRNSE